MRGKNIMWIALAAMLVSVTMTNVAPGQTVAKIYLDPDMVVDNDLSLGVFSVNVNIMDVEDLFAFGFVLKFAPYASVLVVSSVTEGPFLKQGGTTYFKYKISTFDGEVNVGCSLLGAVPGVSGSGLLVTISFTVVEAGECPIELTDIALLDSGLGKIPYEVAHSYYKGPSPEITHAQTAGRKVVPTTAVQEKIGDGDGATTLFYLGHPPVIEESETIYVEDAPGSGNFVAQTRDTDYTVDYYLGEVTFMSAPIAGVRVRADYSYLWEPQKFQCHLKNEGGVPLMIKVRFDCVRLEDGEKTSGWAGQWWSTVTPREPEYLYVNGFDYTREFWTAVGDSPYLDAADDGNYIEGTTDGAQHRWFDFEDITLGPLDNIGRVVLQGYTDGPSTEDVDYDIYSGSFAWLGSLYAAGEPKWVEPRWIGAAASEADPSLLTEEGINNFKALAYFYDPTGIGGAGDILDCMRLKVEFVTKRPVVEPYFEVNAGAGLQVDPGTWALNSLDVGTWICTATAYYSHYGFAWNRDPTVKTFSWWVKL